MKLLAAALISVAIGSAQRAIPSQVALSGSTQDYSKAAITKPLRVGTTLPSTCPVAALFYKSDATAGQNLYGCTSLNTWTAQAGSSAGTVIGPGSSTATALALFANTSGQLLQNSVGLLDSSGNLTGLASVALGGAVGCAGGTAGCLGLAQGTAPSGQGTTMIQIKAPVTVTSYTLTLAGAAATGLPYHTNTAGDVVETILGTTGTAGSVVLSVSPTITGTAVVNAGAFGGCSISFYDICTAGSINIALTGYFSGAREVLDTTGLGIGDNAGKGLGFASDTTSGTYEANLYRVSGSIIGFGANAKTITGSWQALNGTVNNYVRTTPEATASLTTCAAGIAGARSAVNDATAPALGVALTGGGAIFATVHCSGTTNTWIVDGL